MTPANIALSVTVSTLLIILIFELVRRRKLNEEYSWLWIITGIVLLLLSVFPSLLLAITRLIGAALPVSTLFFFSLVFLLLIELHFSIIISRLTNDVRTLTQRLSLLEHEIEQQTKDVPGNH